MSANLDLGRSMYAAWERGDFGSAEWAHPEIGFVIADGPNPGRWTGLAGIVTGFRDHISTWEDYRVEVSEYRELDDGHIFVLVELSGRGKTSGLELKQMRAKGASLFHVRDGKVIKHVVYYDRERAFADLGLAPEAGPA